VVERIFWEKDGPVTVFYTDAGLRFVSLQPNAEAEYVAWYGEAAFSQGNGRYAGMLKDYFSGQPLPVVPMDGHGTPFQEAVWSGLAAIPFGQTRTYKELADQIGRPAAVRAVASAVGKNPLLIFVGCHRVVRGDGSIGDYRAGRDWKARLIKLEQHAVD
jgi:methylated-DNA-[protein]-cysteine S-methyltransferase